MHSPTCLPRTVRDYKTALSVLNALQRGANESTDQSRPNLKPREKTLAWLRHLELDLHKIAFIHIAGSKGKGTASLYTENIIKSYLQKNGVNQKIGCLISPHVTSVQDRIRINSRPITESCFAQNFWSLWEEMHLQRVTTPPMPRYPGLLTLLALYIFVRQGVDVAILETGVGGETDSTNVIAAPIATGITELGLDHVQVLGDSIQSIAWHKAGIFKSGVPAFSVPQTQAATRVLVDRATEKGTEVKFLNDDFLTNNDLNVVPNAHFQRLNASLAVALANAYVMRLTPPGRITPDVARCVESTELPAKFEVIEDGKICWVLSSAHNDMSIAAVCRSFMTLLEKKSDCTRALLFGHHSRRDSGKFLRLIFEHVCLAHNRPFHVALFCSAISSERMDDEELDLPYPHLGLAITRERHKSEWQRLGGKGVVRTLATVKDALELIRNRDTETVVLVIGCAYGAGAARAILVPRG